MVGRLLAAALVAGLMLAALSGCGPKENTSTPPPAGVNGPATGSAPNAGPATIPLRH